MAPTSEERREVAARLRSAAKTDSGSPDYLWNHLEIAVNGWRFGDVIDDSYVFYNSVLSRLADLIDPTCAMEYGGYLPESVKGMLGVYFCSECGSPIYNDVEPAYCPYCGARVVSGDDK